MPCHTRVLIRLDDNAINRKARRNLDLPVEGALSQFDSRRVVEEAGVLRAIEQTRRLAPGASIRRQGNKLSVKVRV